MIKKRRFYCPHNFRYFYSIPRNADVTDAPDVKYASQKTRGEISLEVNHGSLSGRFLDYSLREFGLRRPLEMTYGGNVQNLSPRPKLSTHHSQLSTQYPYLSSREPNVGTKPISLPDRNFQLSTFNFQLSIFNFQLSTFNFQLSTFNFQLKNGGQGANLTA